MKFKTSRKIFIHVDCDCFFASCEMIKDPFLRGKRVCVGGEIIVAASYPAKEMGITVGTPIWKAKNILGKSGYYLGLDHNYYSIISSQLMKYLEDHTFHVEPYSIDEAFCEITGLPELYKKDLKTYLKDLQRDIYNEIGIPVSIGSANTRIKSKIYSKINKPFGIYIGGDIEDEVDLFKRLPLKDIPYIGRSHQERFKYSCRTIYDYISLGFWNIKKQIGKNGTDLWLELCGVNTFKIRKNKEIKSLSRSRSFNKYITSDYEFLKEKILENFELVFEGISEKHLEIKKVGLLLRDKNFATHIFEKKLPEHTNLRIEILKEVLSLFKTFYDPRNLYRSTGIILSDFRSYLPKQTSIFDTPLRAKENNYKLIKSINELNRKYGSHKVGYGYILLEKGYDAQLKIVN